MARFIPHVSAYFARDKLDKDIDYRVLFVEQDVQKPFNRGLLKNIGFRLLEDAGFTSQVQHSCFRGKPRRAF